MSKPKKIYIHDLDGFTIEEDISYIDDDAPTVYWDDIEDDDFDDRYYDGTDFDAINVLDGYYF